MQRRYFLYGSLAAAGFSRRPAVAASDKVNVVLMGIGGRGRAMAEYFGSLPDVRIPVVCDVDSNVVERVTKMVTESVSRSSSLRPTVR
jgi:NADH/NAD ratio-sensing transcriptional regulator Rex